MTSDPSTNSLGGSARDFRAATRSIALPEPSAVSAPFWDATSRHVLCLQRCTECEGYEWTPQMACSRCHTETLAWREVSGRATIYSYTIVHRAPTPGFHPPYVLIIAELDEGPHMLSDLIDVRLEDVTIGMPVQVAFEDFDGLSLPHFTPTSDSRI